MTNTLLTITGPSLSGKSTLENLLVDKYKMDKLISFTTRPPRQGEVDKEDYYFMDKPTAISKIEAGEMAEHVDFQGHLYGLLGSELETKLQKNSCIAVVEPNGVQQLAYYCQDKGLRHRSVFLTNSPVVLAARFLKRFQEDDKALAINYAKRFVNLMLAEQRWIHDFDYDYIYLHFDKSNEKYVLEKIYSDAVWMGEN